MPIYKFGRSWYNHTWFYDVIIIWRIITQIQLWHIIGSHIYCAMMSRNALVLFWKRFSKRVNHFFVAFIFIFKLTKSIYHYSWCFSFLWWLPWSFLYFHSARIKMPINQRCYFLWGSWSINSVTQIIQIELLSQLINSVYKFL